MAFSNETTKNYPQLSFEDASKMMANIFDSCGIEPNTIPLEKLASYSEYRREKYSFQKILLAIMLIIFCLLPLCFVLPEVSMVKVGAKESATEYYEIQVDTFLPIKSVVASIDGEEIPVYEIGRHIYSVRPETSGKLDVVVTLINGQFETKNYSVTCIDKDPPEVTAKAKVDNSLKLVVEDAQSGIDWENVCAKDSNGSVIAPTAYDETTGEVLFKYPTEDTTIYIPDLAGNVLSVNIKV